MVWAKIDDEILDNPKIAQAGLFGFAFHVAAITWCCRNLTDGFIPYARVASFFDVSAAKTEWISKAGLPSGVEDRLWREVMDIQLEADAFAKHLVEIGLWDKVDGGYQIHDFLEYNPSREEVLTQRAKRAEAGKVGGQRSQLNRRSQANAQALARASAQANVKQVLKQSSSKHSSKSEPPYPIPIPNIQIQPPLDPPPLEKPSGRRRKSETFCPASEASEAEVSAWCEHWKIPKPQENPEVLQFFNWHRAEAKGRHDWLAAWRNWESRAAKFRPPAQSGLRLVQQAPAEGRAWKIHNEVVA